jgi:hypothetical protein
MPISDAELFAACEGRTARKGARGEQTGKLHRADPLYESIRIPTEDEHMALEKVSRKKKINESADVLKKRKKTSKASKKSKKSKKSKNSTD